MFQNFTAGNAQVTFTMNPPISARFVRLVPLFTQGDEVGAEVSLYGCAAIAANYSIAHTYASPGRYLITVDAANLVSNRSFTYNHTSIVAQAGLTFQPPTAITYGVTERVPFTTSAGTSVTFNCSFNGAAVQVVYNDSSKQGYVVVPPTTYQYVGSYLLDLTYDTTITNALNVQVTIPVEINITGLAVAPAIIPLEINTAFTLTVFLDSGTNVNVSVDWNDTFASYMTVNNASLPKSNV